MTIKAMTDIMHTYFDWCISCAKGTAKHPDGKPVRSQEREVASLAGLAHRLGMTKEDIVKLDGGTDEERAFYTDMMIRYEMAVDAMYNGKMIGDTAYKTIKQGELAMLSANSGDSSKNISLVFPEWNAPDDWEDYKEIRETCELYGITIKKATNIIAAAAKELKS